MAEEVGVEPTRHFLSASLVLKTRCPTGDIALPEFASARRYRTPLRLIAGVNIAAGEICVNHHALIALAPRKFQSVKIF